MSIDYDNPEIYMVLLKICQKYSVDPSSSLDVESFFRKILAEYSRALDSLEIAQWLEATVADNFICTKDRPRWIQNAEWPFYDNNPIAQFIMGHLFCFPPCWSFFANRLFHSTLEVVERCPIWVKGEIYHFPALFA